MARDRTACVLTIAGLDSSGGAGITADTLAITSLGLSAAATCTAVTAQTRSGVRASFSLPSSMVEAQLRAVFEEYQVLAVKTGMLVNAEIVDLVAEFLRKKSVELSQLPQPRRRYAATDAVPLPALPIVVDPVFTATAGGTLLTDEGVSTLIEKLLPLACVVTPNLAEAERLAKRSVKTPEDMKAAARRIYELGAKNVIVTGGHLQETALDVIYDGSRFEELRGRKLPGTAHGTGCTYSAALTAYLALGTPIVKAAAGAKRLATTFIEEAL